MGGREGRRRWRRPADSHAGGRGGIGDDEGEGGEEDRWGDRHHRAPSRCTTAYAEPTVGGGDGRKGWRLGKRGREITELGMQGRQASRNWVGSRPLGGGGEAITRHACGGVDDGATRYGGYGTCGDRGGRADSSGGTGARGHPGKDEACGKMSPCRNFYRDIVQPMCFHKSSSSQELAKAFL
ncbi:hypothetical protein U9M48_019259 [Paspalum notatum var. saurae]|uniref:Uncharacterized protein n=1 Tax=Paspalum notatum var. saurae TaxID=547442 RepID=A0AAQ3TDK1_PASNO